MEMRKILICAAIAAAIIFGPIFGLSTNAMGCYQGMIDKNPNSDSAKNWQIRLADVCMRTMRPELGAEMYGKFAQRFPEDPRTPEVLWLKAKAHERADDKKQAIDTLVHLTNNYSDTQYGKDADERLNRTYQYFIREKNE